MNGLLLINLGTPEAPQTRPVRRYLAEFLADPRVLDMPAPLRWFLLYFIILPFRPRRSAAAYRKVWDDQRGSPLLFHSQDLTDAVRETLGSGWSVELGMRYGQPAMQDALDRLIDAGCERIFVMPLYPQYASSTTGSTLEALFEMAGTRPWIPSITVVPPFFNHPAYLDATVQAARATVEAADSPHVVFSFHGVPERQVEATDLSSGRSHCLKDRYGCCDVLTAANRGCYRAQCVATARSLAERLDLPDDRWTLSFQSRLGRIPWLQPYTDHTLEELGSNGTDRVVVLTPSFVADCLETLEEIGMEAKQEFAGELTVAPCLNAHPRWVDAVAQIVLEAAGETLRDVG